MATSLALPDSCKQTLQQYLDSTVFRALGDPTRLALLARLASAPEPLTVTELSSCCGVHLSGVSRHLKLLNEARLISAERQGREVRYQLECGHLTEVLRGMADALEACQASCCTANETDGCATECAAEEETSR